MDEHKEPGISIFLISLLAAHFELANPGGEKEYHLALVGLFRTEAEGGKFLDVEAAFDLMHGIEKPLFKFTCVFGARYERQGDQSMPWEKFTTVMAVTHLVPYLREFVSNMTNRSPAPALILPPINAHALLAEFEKRKQQSNPPLSPSGKPA